MGVVTAKLHGARLARIESFRMVDEVLKTLARTESACPSASRTMMKLRRSAPGRG